MRCSMEGATAVQGFCLVLLLFALFLPPAGAADVAPALAFDLRNNRHLLVYVQRDIGLSPRIYGRWLGCDGSGQGAAFLISDVNSASKSAPFVVYESLNRRFLVVWEDDRGGWSSDIYGQALSDDGTLIGGNFAVCVADGEQRNPKAACEGETGRCLVAWDDGRGGTNRDIYGQWVNGGSTLQGMNFPIAEAVNDQQYPAVAHDPLNRRFLVAWEDSRSGVSFDIYAQLLDASGTPQGAAISVSSAEGDQRKPKVAFDSANGAYLVVWQDDRSLNDTDLYGQRIGAGGAIVGSNFPVSEATGDQANPAVVFDAAKGRFLVVWEDSRSGASDLHARYLNADGTPGGSDFTVSSAGGDQIAPSAAYNSAKANVLVAYETRRLEGDVELSFIQTALVGPSCEEGDDRDGANDEEGQGSGGGGGCFITAAGAENPVIRRRGMP